MFVGNSGGDNDIFACDPSQGGNTDACDNASDWTRLYNSANVGYNSIVSSAVFDANLYMGMGNGTGDGDLVECNPTYAGDLSLCDNAGDFNNFTPTINNGGTISTLAAMANYDGTLMIGMAGTASGDGQIDEVRKTYSVTSNSGTGFQATYAFTVYNGYLYAGRGNASGNGQVWYYHRARSVSNKLNFETNSSTASIWYDNSSYNNTQVGDQGLQSGVFKFSQGIITSAGSYDLAESYTASEAGLEAGDVVASDQKLNASVRRSDKAYDPYAFGVVSTKPGFLLSSDDQTGTVPVALTGRVPVKFSAENGPVQPGDALTAANIPGYAMKATADGPMIGRALAGFKIDDGTATSTATGTVLMLVQAGYHMSASSADSLSQLMTGSGSSTGDALQSPGATPETALPAGSQISQGLGVLTLVARDATFTGNVTVLGPITLRGPVVLGASNAGRVKVDPGDYIINVLFPKTYPIPPHVFATPEIVDVSGGTGFDHAEWDGAYYLANVTTTGFTIELPGGGYCPTYTIKPCPIELYFNWFVVGFEDTSGTPATAQTAPSEGNPTSTTTSSGTTSGTPTTDPTGSGTISSTTSGSTTGTPPADPTPSGSSTTTSSGTTSGTPTSPTSGSSSTSTSSGTPPADPTPSGSSTATSDPAPPTDTSSTSTP